MITLASFLVGLICMSSRSWSLYSTELFSVVRLCCTRGRPYFGAIRMGSLWSRQAGQHLGVVSELEKEQAKKLASRKLDIPQYVRDFPFKFENIALEGGGTKTYAFLGSLKVLEDLGVLQNIKRFAGTSGGAIICALLSIGCTVEELYDFFSVNLAEISGDASYGYFSLIPNLIYRFGWHPGNSVRTFFQDIIEKKTGNKNITFRQLYEQHGTELCICVSNVTRMTLQYCHTKTTPNMPISDAIRMSTSLPLFYQPFKYEDDFYVDGGLLCNFPVFAFDGWYLSMEPDNAFLCKLGGKDPPFETVNKKTIGMIVYASGEAQMLRSELHDRYKGFKLERPNTKLAREREEDCEEQLNKAKRKDELLLSAHRFLEAMKKHDLNRDGKISKTEFLKAIETMDKKDIRALFDKESVDENDFDEVDVDDNNMLSFMEFMQLMDRKGVTYRQTMEGQASSNNFNSFGGFSGAMFSTIALTLSKLLLKPYDIERTIGVHTDYIRVTDFDIEFEDREFMVQLAEYATIAFLKEHIEKASKS